jgi:inhibitor of cysteine peptidase
MMRGISILTAVICLSMGFVAYAEPEKNTIPIFTDDTPVAAISSDHPTFTIKLKSNPTTGYAWYLRDFNASLIEPVKHVFEMATDKKLIGASGYELWTFKVKPAGFVVPQQMMIRFVYARPSETADNSTLLIFKVTTQKVEAKENNASSAIKKKKTEH